MPVMCRPIRLALTIFAVAWFAVIMPAHQRGQIRLPGAGAASSGCCAEKAAAHCATGAPDSGASEEDGDPVRSCAVCHLVAKLSTPDALVIPLPRPTPVASLRLTAPLDPDCAADLRPQRSRAPPVLI